MPQYFRLMTMVGFVCLLGLVCQVPVAVADEFVLAEDGHSVAPIIVFEGAPPMTRQAADELAEYLEKISGVRPQIIEGQPDPIPGNAIWVGYQSTLDSLFPDLNFEFEHPEEILIAASENHLVIAGRDVWDDDHLTIEGPRGPIQGVQQEYGTVNAVYTFLQDYLDVRWLLPGEIGIDVIERETIRLEPFEYRYHPHFRWRSGLIRFSDRGSHRGLAHDWVRFQRLQLDSIHLEVGGHAYTDWWERFHDDHPDYFALQPDGTRSGFPGPRTVKICVSNPDVWEQWLDDVAQQIEANPNRRIFSASQNDGYHSGHCICENCRAWDHPDGEPRTYRWEGVSQTYVAMTYRYVTYVNKLAELLKERYPDRDYYVRGGGGYGHTRPAPVGVRPADNVIINSVANFLLRPGMVDGNSPNNTTHREQLAAWGEVAPNLMWRPNLGSPAGWQAGMPSVQFDQAVDDFRFAAAHQVQGVSTDTVWEHWATQAPLYYLMAHLAWNPDVDTDALMRDYYERGFGPAADEVEAYWKLMEQTTLAIVNDQLNGWRAAADELRQAGELLDAAAQRLDDDDARYRDRLTFVRAGYDYARLMSQSRRLMMRWDESQEADTDAAERMRANTERIRQIQRDFPKGFNSYVAPGKHRVSAYHLDK